MSIEELKRLPFEPILDAIIHDLKVIQYVSKEDIVEFKRDISKEDKRLNCFHELRVQNQVIFRNVRHLDTFSKSIHLEVDFIKECDLYFVKTLITYLLLHKLPSIVEISYYRHWKDTQNNKNEK